MYIIFFETKKMTDRQKKASKKPQAAVESLEIRLLLEGIFQKCGYDFRDYALASIRRRIWRRVKGEKLTTISALQEKVLHDPECLERLLEDFSVSVSDFFRNPAFFRIIREKVLPVLRTYPFVRIWHAGCSSGEEAYSLAILLHEECLYEKCRIYATDFNPAVLEKAKAGIFPLKRMKQFSENYIRSGGKAVFSEYYTARYDNALFKSFLRKNILFTQHNLVTDESFNEFNMILCRNVMIYFNRELQKRTHRLIYESLPQWGVLGLGEKESLKFTPYENRYECLDQKQKLFRKTV